MYAELALDHEPAREIIEKKLWKVGSPLTINLCSSSFNKVLDKESLIADQIAEWRAKEMLILAIS